MEIEKYENFNRAEWISSKLEMEIGDRPTENL